MYKIVLELETAGAEKHKIEIQIFEEGSLLIEKRKELKMFSGQKTTAVAHVTDYDTEKEASINELKEEIKKIGLEYKDGDSAIVPIMLYDAALSQKFADKLLEEGIYAIGFFCPVVPKEQARIRVQLSAAHEKHHLDKAIAAFEKVGKELRRMMPWIEN